MEDLKLMRSWTGSWCPTERGNLKCLQAYGSSSGSIPSRYLSLPRFLTASGLPISTCKLKMGSFAAGSGQRWLTNTLIPLQASSLKGIIYGLDIHILGNRCHLELSRSLDLNLWLFLLFVPTERGLSTFVSEYESMGDGPTIWGHFLLKRIMDHGSSGIRYYSFFYCMYMYIYVSMLLSIVADTDLLDLSVRKVVDLTSSLGRATMDGLESTTFGQVEGEDVTLLAAREQGAEALENFSISVHGQAVRSGLCQDAWGQWGYCEIEPGIVSVIYSALACERDRRQLLGKSEATLAGRRSQGVCFALEPQSRS